MMMSKHDEWGDEDRPCLDCPVRRDLEDAENNNNNVMLVLLFACLVGFLVGFAVGVLS